MKGMYYYIKRFMFAVCLAGIVSLCVYACARETRFAAHVDKSARKALGKPAYADDAPLGIRYTKKHPLIIAADWNRRPFSFMNDRGEPDGMHVELLREIFDKFHLDYEVKLVDRATYMREMKAGRVQLMVEFSNLPVPSDVKMGKTNVGEYHVAALRRRTTPQMRSVMLLSPKDTVLVRDKGFTLRFISNHFNGNVPFHMKELPSDEAIQHVFDGKAPYFITGEMQLRTAIERYGFEDEMEIDAIDMVDGTFRFFSTDAKLLEALDRNLRDMTRTGQMASLQKKWNSPGQLTSSKRYVANEIALVVGLVFLIVMVIITVVYMRMRSSSQSLKNEFQQIIGMVSDMTNCHLVAYNNKSTWVHNITGDFLPKHGAPMLEYEKLIHSDDLLLHYNTRDIVAEHKSELEPLQLHMHKYDEPDNWRLMSVAGGTAKDVDGSLAYVYITLLDVTDQLRYQQQLTLDLCRYQGLQDYSELGIAHYTVDGRMENCNPNYFSMFGKERREQGEMFARNTKLRELCMTLGGVVLRNDMDTWYNTHVKISELNLDTYLTVNIRSVRGQDNRHQGYMVMIGDSNILRAGHEQSRMLSERLRRETSLVQRYSMEIKYIMWRNHFIIFHWKAGTRYFEYSSEANVFGRIQSFENYVDTLYDEEDRKKMTLALEHPEALFGQPGSNQHSLNKHKTIGHTIEHDFSPEWPDVAWTRVEWEPEFDGEGNLMGCHGVMIDITDTVNNRRTLSEAKEKALNVEQVKKNFLQNMTHELRTPLNAVNGFAEMLLFPCTPEERKEYINFMIQNSRLLFSLVDNILQMSIIDLEGLKVTPHAEDFGAYFKEHGPRLAKFVVNDDVRFLCDTPYGSLPLVVDVQRVMQVMEIFVSNAAKFTKEGFVHVGYRYLGGMLTVYCRDTGLGVAQDFQPVIFQEFTKADSFVPGIGLGLSLANVIAKAMNGNIDLYSKQGHGSTFSMTIPVVQPAIAQ